MASFSIVGFLYKQLVTTPALPTTDLTGRTYIVTGGNTGLGKEAARHLVRMNADRVIITSRDASKGAAAKDDIETTTGRKDVIEVWHLDLQDYNSVRSFADRVNGLKRVDGVLENAAKATAIFTIVQGHESTLMVNTISTLYLGLLLLPKLKEVAQQYNIVPVLTTVSSEVHFMTAFKERERANILETLDNPATANMNDRYQISKLLQVYGSREIAKRTPIDKDHVIVNFATPGLCRSELARESKSKALKLQFALLGRTSEAGARFLVHALTEAGEKSHGQYLDNCKICPCAKLVDGPEGPELQRRVWSELSAEFEKIQPGVVKNLDA